MLYKDCKKFVTKLALEMSINHKTQIDYLQGGIVFKRKSQWDQFFDNDIELKIIIRSCIPLLCKGETYGFTHKTIQEFIVAQDIYNVLNDIEVEDLDVWR